MKEELKKLLKIKDATYYFWRNKHKIKLIMFFQKYFSKDDLKELNKFELKLKKTSSISSDELKELGSSIKIAKLDYLYNSSTISMFCIYHWFITEIKDRNALDNLISFLILWKKKSTKNEIGDSVSINFSYDYIFVIELHKEFGKEIMNHQKDKNLHLDSTDFMLKLRDINIQDFLFLHYNIMTNFKFMIEILEQKIFHVEDVFNPQSINFKVRDDLFLFLIHYYEKLYNLDLDDFKGKEKYIKFKRIKQYVDKNFTSDDFFDILDRVRELRIKN